MPRLYAYPATLSPLSVRGRRSKLTAPLERGTHTASRRAEPSRAAPRTTPHRTARFSCTSPRRAVPRRASRGRARCRRGEEVPFVVQLHVPFARGISPLVVRVPVRAGFAFSSLRFAVVSSGVASLPSANLFVLYPRRHREIFALPLSTFLYNVIIC